MLNSSNLQAKLSGINLSQVLGARELFSNLMFELQTGEILLVRGANGCGKTSLLRIICGLALPESGTVFWDKKNIHEQPSEYRTILTYVGHRAGVKLDLTPEENLQLVAVNQAQENRLSIETTLDQLGLRKQTHLQCRYLSQGQLRRVALGRLWLSGTLLWVLDEPFTALDDKGITDMEILLEAHTRLGGMVVMASHRVPLLRDATITELVL